MPLRHILEYDETGIRDLMGNLDSVGQMNPYKGTLWAHFNTYKNYSGYWSTFPVIVCFLETEPFYGTGDENKDKTIMLEKIQKGEFKRPSHPDARSWAGLKNGNKAASDLMEKRGVQSLSKTCSDIDDLIEGLRESLVLVVDAASTVLVYGFIGPEESPYLVTANLDSPFQNGSGINYIQ